MNSFKYPTAAALLLLISTLLTTSTVAQQRRQAPARPQPKAAPTPAPTFDTLMPADTYNIYVEVRGVGQLIRSSAATDILDPIIKLGAPPKEFKKFIAWLTDHADEVMTSRLLVATWAATKDLPEAVIAIEFPSAEEATKFAGPLNQFLPTVLQPKVAQPSSEVKPTTNPTPPKPNFYLQQAGSLIILTPTPLNLKKLKPAGSKLLTEDINFRAARNRFNSETVFAFVDMKSIQRLDEEQEKRREEENRKNAEEARKLRAEMEKRGDKEEEAQPPEEVRALIEAEQTAKLQGPVPVLPGEGEEPPPPDPATLAFEAVTSSIFGLQAKWPEGIGLALSIDDDSFDVRALFVNQPGEKSDAVPFMPMLIPGQPFVPEAPNVLPADSELFVSLSLDLAQVYTLMSRPRPNSVYVRSSGNTFTTVHEEVHESPFAAIEKKLELNLKNDVLPMLGSEVAFRLPIKDFNLLGLVRPGTPKPAEPAPNGGPLLLVSLRDKEGVRALMPKLVDAMGFKGASAFAQTERRDDTEIVSYANLFSYAFIGNFLVLSNDPATTKHAVESYLKRETLSGDSHFRNSTRWQPRPAQGQVYISPALMESYRTWVQQSSSLSEQSRAILTRLTEVSQPITYSLSNEGLGPLHELRLPKNLVLMAVTGFSSESNPPPTLVNERRAMGSLHSIAYAQQRYKDTVGNGSYATMEQLQTTEMVSEDTFQSTEYKIEMTVTGDKFEVTAVPVEYGRSGKMSYFIDQTLILRGGDRNGAPPSSSDPPIN